MEVKYELTPIQEQIWQDKYRFIAPAGVPRLTSDNSVEDTWQRIAHALAEPEGNESRMWEKRFYSTLSNFQFLPAGRIIAGAGTWRDVTLFNCFVLGEVPDSMSGIFQRLKDGALTMQQGGGIGTDFSTLRPNGSDVHGVAAKASGPLSFMDVWDAMCKTIMSAGARRGAMMGTLRCDHPDIEAFIEAKRDPTRFRNFNLSVLVTDGFMIAVNDGSDWPLQFNGKVYSTVKARELWHKITRAAYDCAEPGVIFIDRINATNNLAYCETIYATNPCAEQPLPPNGACLLGSMNLAAFIREPFMPNVYFNEHDIITKTKIAVRMMDNVIDVSNYPLPEQRQEALHKRRIGLGVTGLADALAMCGLHYGSPEACRTAAVWMKTITRAAYEESINLAAEKGKFPAFSPKMGRAYYPDRGERATRNSHLISIAPTGTISLFAGNISSGIEPIFEWEFTRKILMPDGTRQPVQVEDWAVRLYREMFPGKELPPQFYARAHELSPSQHLAMQAAIQPHVDTSISKTVNCPASMPFEDFEQLYLDAYEKGIKVCAAFRENTITGSILEANPAKEELFEPSAVAKDRALELQEPPPNQPAHYKWGEGPRLPENQREMDAEREAQPIELPDQGQLLDLIHEASGLKSAPVPSHAYAIVPPPRQPVMHGRTHKIKWGSHAIYITINDNPDGSPYEIFMNSKDSAHYAWSVALTRMVSAIFRRGGDIGFVIEELKAIHDPRGGAYMNGKYIPSIQAAIGHVIEYHMAGGSNGLSLQPEVAETPAAHMHFPVPSNFCPKCGSSNVWFPKPNCLTCRDCSFSNCE